MFDSNMFNSILDYLIVVCWTWIMFDNYNFVIELNISSSYWHVEQVFWMFIIERSQIKHTHTPTNISCIIRTRSVTHRMLNVGIIVGTFFKVL